MAGEVTSECVSVSQDVCPDGTCPLAPPGDELAILDAIQEEYELLLKLFEAEKVRREEAEADLLNLIEEYQGLEDENFQLQGQIDDLELENDDLRGQLDID